MGKQHSVEHQPSIALDVWGTGSSEPRGIVNLKRQYAKAAAILAETQRIRLCYAGTASDEVWLHEERLLDHATFRRFRIPGRIARRPYLGKIFPVSRLLGQPDLFHSFTLFPFQNGRTTVIGTLVDFVPMRTPEFVPISFTAEQIAWCKWASKHPKAGWIAISEQTRQDALALGRLHEHQVTVVHPGAQDDMFIEPNPQEISSTLASLGLPSRYLLCVNTLNPRKNHARLIDAWDAGKFAASGWTLVLVGHAAGNPLTEALQANRHAGVVWLGYVSRQQLRHLYYGCAAFLYPSLYEGYGIPVAEAIVAGKTVLTSQRSSMLEIVGADSIQVDPRDVDSLTAGIRKLIDCLGTRTHETPHLHSQRFKLRLDAVSENLLQSYLAHSQPSIVGPNQSNH